MQGYLVKLWSYMEMYWNIRMHAYEVYRCEDARFSGRCSPKMFWPFDATWMSK